MILKGPVQANSWELFLAGEKVCPLCSCCLWFGFGWFWVVVFVAKIATEGQDLFTFDAQDVKSDVIVQRHYAFMAARGDEKGCEDTEHEKEDVCKADENCEWVSKKCKDKEICPKPPAKEREGDILYDGMPAWVFTVYETNDDVNILDDDILGYINKFEKKLLTDANGAKLKGNPSRWDEDWCRMAYPSGSSAGAKGKCASIQSFLDPYAMTAEGLEAVKTQVDQGYTNAGLYSCMCTTDDDLCAICNADGTEKPLASWPSSITTCMQGWIDNASSATSPSNASGASNALCSDSSSSLGSLTLAAIPPSLTGFCSSLPSCQFAPPGGSRICASSAFYRPTDSDNLLKGTAKDAVLNKMCNASNLDWFSLKTSVLPMTFDCSSKKTTVGKTTFVPGGSGKDDGMGEKFEKDYVAGLSGWLVKEQLLEEEIEKESGGKLRVMMWSSATFRNQFLNLLIMDAILSIGALVFVWAYMWWTLESAFLASAAIFEILFSVPVGMSLWTVIFQQKVSVLQVLVLYMILGIGADDAFIMYDAWLQARFAGDEVTDKTSRFAWAYRRSFSAMAVTTSTTCGSFLIGAFSPLPQVRDFCIFAAIVVLVDWLFCITFFASACFVYDRYIRSDTKRGECGGPGCCCGLVQVCAQKCCKKCVDEPPEPDAPPKKRAMERWSEGPVFNFLKRVRWVCVVFWVLLTISMLVSAGASLRTAEKAPPVGREGLDVTRVLDILMEHYSILDRPTAAISWGIDEEDPIKEWKDDGNVPRFSAAAAAKLTSPQGQKELLDLCRAPDLGKDTRCTSRECLVLGKENAGRCAANEAVLRKEGVFVPDDLLCETGRYCFMEEFARYWAYKVAGASCAGKSTSSACTGASCLWDSGRNLCYSSKTEDDYVGFPTADFLSHLGSDGFAAYREHRAEVLGANRRNFDIPAERLHTGFRLNQGKTALTFAWVTFNATYPVQNTVEQANDWYDRWESFHNKYAPDIGGIQTTELYLFMVTQNEMVKAAALGIVLSLIMALVVMVVATQNWWVSLMGLANITGITSVFLGLMPIIGWSLGEYECIFLIAVVGLSVDYTLHLLHVYNHSPEATREDRARHALGEMGISVTNSAITTMLAAVMLFSCNFYFFLQFGGFIFFVITISIIMSITFLIPLLLLIGPEDKQGEIPVLRRCMRESRSCLSLRGTKVVGAE